MINRVLPPSSYRPTKRSKFVAVRRHSSQCRESYVSVATSTQAPATANQDPQPGVEQNQLQPDLDIDTNDFEDFSRSLRVSHPVLQQDSRQRTAADKRAAAEDNWQQHQEPDNWLSGHDARFDTLQQLLCHQQQLLTNRQVQTNL